MSDEHKAALAVGRRQAKAIKRYLEALGTRRPGRPVTPESLQARVDRIDARLDTEPDPLKRVELQQQKIDATAALERLKDAADISELEAGFVTHAKAYSDRKGISYAAWRGEGVPAATLKKAGIGR